MSEIVVRLIFAVIGFVLFGLLALAIGAFSALDAVMTGLLGACLAVLIIHGNE